MQPMTLFARTVRSLAAVCLVVLGLCAVAVAWLSHPPGSGGSRRQSLLMVTSGSMVPAFHAGDAILVRPADEMSRAALRPDRIITFRAAGTGQFVTHRIVSVISHPDGHTEFVTKGDANPDPDIDPVDADDVVATLGSVIPYGGYAMRAVGDRRIPALLLVAAVFGNWSLALAGRRTPKGSPVMPGGNTHQHTRQGTTP